MEISVLNAKNLSERVITLFGKGRMAYKYTAGIGYMRNVLKGWNTGQIIPVWRRQRRISAPTENRTPIFRLKI